MTVDINSLESRPLIGLDSRLGHRKMIRNNASDLQDYLKDLETWETDVKKTDTSLSNQKSILKEVCY